MLSIARIATEEARALIDHARELSEQMGVPMCIAVVDESGYLVAFERMNHAKITSVSIAVDKAFTAAGARNTTAFYGQVSQPGGPAWGINQTNGGHFCVIPGGVPLTVDGVVVGGIGLSGGTAHQDDEIAVEVAAGYAPLDAPAQEA
jgi:uncharacterized protein GlcG (DUF336 family)